MKSYESNLSNDTVMSGGLVAMVVGWVLLAAVQGPVGANAEQAFAAPASASVSTAVKHAVNAPAPGIPGAAVGASARKQS